MVFRLFPSRTFGSARYFMLVDNKKKNWGHIAVDNIVFPRQVCWLELREKKKSGVVPTDLADSKDAF